MSQIIAGKNAKVLNGNKEQKRDCSCPKNKTCPLDGKCLSENLVYQATVTHNNDEKKTYIGQTSTNFKARLGVHIQTFNNMAVTQTSLSRHIWESKSKGIDPVTEGLVSWKMIDRGRPFSPINGVCQLCLKEKFYILHYPEMANLNKRSETFSACMHKKSFLLIKKKRGRPPKKSPGSWSPNPDGCVFCLRKSVSCKLLKPEDCLSAWNLK